MKCELNKNMLKKTLGSVNLFFLQFVVTVSIRKELKKNKMSCLFAFCSLTCLSLGIICYQIHLGLIVANETFESFLWPYVKAKKICSIFLGIDLLFS
jgi:hypothetical protein